MLITVTSHELVAENHSVRRTNLLPCKIAGSFLVRNAFETYTLKINPNFTNHFSANFSRLKLPQINKTQTFFFTIYIMIATQCKVNTAMTFCGKLNTEVHDRNVTNIFAVVCKRALTGFD